jgi:Holliday junction resolvase RusA-like endonuclease
MATNLELTRLRWTGYEPGDALVVVLHFHLERPKTVRRLEPTVKPDLDKLVRAVLDGITDARAWNDDSQVIAVWATKSYGVPGVEIRVYNKSVTNQDTV